jgi:hypothetical protein
MRMRKRRSRGSSNGGGGWLDVLFDAIGAVIDALLPW